MDAVFCPSAGRQGEEEIEGGEEEEEAEEERFGFKTGLWLVGR